MAQRMHVVSSFIITAPSCVQFLGRSTADRSPNSSTAFSIQAASSISLLRPTRRIRFSGQTSTQPLQATHFEVSKTVLTLQRRQRDAWRRASLSG